MDSENYSIEDGLTEKQIEALQLAGSGKTRLLFYGGARSGKTFLICCVIVYRAVKYKGSRHLIARLRYSHARGSIWLDTLRNAVKFMGVESAVAWNESDHYVKIGDSEIWVDGLDDKDRVDKILGREYSTIFLNEVSQIAYPTVTTVLTRLAQKTAGKNIAFFDCNPPSRLHWTYKLFIQGVDPESEDKIDMQHYGSIQMNPVHNTEHLPDGYIEDILGHLPEDKRRRFLLGEFGDAQGVIFTDWDIIDEIPDEVRRNAKRSPGLDFGFSVAPAALIDCYIAGDDIYIDELIYEKELTNQEMANKIKAFGIADEMIQADSAEPKSIRELKLAGCRVYGAEKGADSIRAGIDWLKSHKIHITRRSANTIVEFQEYVWSTDRDGNFEPKPIDDYNHAIDAIRYAVDPIRRRSAPRITVPIKR